MRLLYIQVSLGSLSPIVCMYLMGPAFTPDDMRELDTAVDAGTAHLSAVVREQSCHLETEHLLHEGHLVCDLSKCGAGILRHTCLVMYIHEVVLELEVSLIYRVILTRLALY
jgi:hypothetical protein